MILACSGNTAYGFEAIRGDNIDDRTPQTLANMSYEWFDISVVPEIVLPDYEVEVLST